MFVLIFYVTTVQLRFLTHRLSIVLKFQRVLALSKYEASSCKVFFFFTFPEIGINYFCKNKFKVLTFTLTLSY